MTINNNVISLYKVGIREKRVNNELKLKYNFVINNIIILINNIITY